MQLTPAQSADELRFWLNQDKEHMLFFSLGFVDPALKDEAKRLYDGYELALRQDDLSRASQILSQSQNFKTRALALAASHWVGWIFPLFIDHTKRELDYMIARVQPGGLSARDELCFGNRINAEHVAFAAHLLDPSELAAHNLANHQLRPAAENLANRCMTETYGTLLALSKNSGSDIDRLFTGLDLAKTKSVIHPVLAAHVIREGKRFLQTMSAMPA